MSVILRFENAIFTSLYLKTQRIFTSLYLKAQRIVQDGKNYSISILNSFHHPNRTSITQLHAVTNQYYIITLILNPENKSMTCKQIFQTCSRLHGLLYFTHLICTLSLMYTSCILRSPFFL